MSPTKETDQDSQAIQRPFQNPARLEKTQFHPMMMALNLVASGTTLSRHSNTTGLGSMDQLGGKDKGGVKVKDSSGIYR